MSRALGFCRLHGSGSDLAPVDGACNSEPDGWEGFRTRTSPAGSQCGSMRKGTESASWMPGLLSSTSCRARPSSAEDVSQWVEAGSDGQFPGHLWADRWGTRSVGSLTQQASV